MDMEKQQQEIEGNVNWNGGDHCNNNGLFVKVMTDEQMEVLRKQIAVYATICQQLVDLHKSLTSNQDLAGIRKINGRQRWTPTPIQLQILERIFDQGNGTPSKQKIKEITSELSRHGQISETNVYNWFQNRRARSKRKQHVSGPNNGDSEVEIEVESPNDKKTRSEGLTSQHNSAPRIDDLCFQHVEKSSGMSSVDVRANKTEPVFPSDANSKPAASLGQMSFFGSMLSNPKVKENVH